MKNSILIILIAGIFSFNSSASGYCQKRDGEWKQKMMSEKIAFFTTEIGITPEEGQDFWPVYNQINKEKDEAMKLVFENFRKLSDAMETGKSEKEIQRLLDDYLAAMKKQRDIDNGASSRYMKVLSVEKVAKLYLAEEKFRRQQIHKLHESKRNR